MLVFSPLARQLIDHAVAETLDTKEKEIWMSWVTDHPRLRRTGDPLDDGTGPTPKYILDIALRALLAFAQRKKRELESTNLSEDDRLDVESDLTHIGSVIRFVSRGRSGGIPQPQQVTS